MRWIFSLLLLANAVYFVWQNPLASVNKIAEVVPEGARELRLVSEIDVTLLLPRSNRSDSKVDERSLAGPQVIEGLTEDNSLDGPSFEVGSSESSSLKTSSPGSDSLEDLSDKASLREVSAADEPSALLNMLLDEKPATDQPVTDQPATEPSVTYRSVTDQSVSEQSVSEQSATEPPATDRSVTDQSVLEQSATDQSVAEPPATEPSVTYRSVTDQSVSEQSVSEQSVAEPPVAEPPATDRSATDRSVTDQSVTDQSVLEQSVLEQSATDQSVIEPPATDQSVIDQPVIDSSVTEQSVTDLWCQVVSGLREEGGAQQLLEALLKAGLSAEVKTTEMEAVLAFELIVDRPAAAGDNAVLMNDFDHLSIEPQELQLNGMAVYVLGRFDSRNEVDEALSRLKGRLAPRIYQVVSKDSIFEVWVESDEGAETSNKINLLASDFLPEIKIEKKSCKGVASTEGRD